MPAVIKSIAAKKHRNFELFQKISIFSVYGGGNMPGVGKTPDIPC
jgi:hypothetical protein